MLITFCGHGEIAQQEPIREWLQSVLQTLIDDGAREFYLGGYGDFDRLAAVAVRTQKKHQPDIQSVLVLPYLNSTMDASGYDMTVYPPLETVPPRFAISKRNRWMVEQADVVVAYVTHDWGGAATTLSYARRKRKQIILYPGLPGKES